MTTSKTPSTAPSQPSSEELQAGLKSAQARVAELEDVLYSVAQQFRLHGNNFPDGIDSRIFRWVDDALAGAKAPAQKGSRG